jgi:hypothetical protein
MLCTTRDKCTTPRKLPPSLATFGVFENYLKLSDFKTTDMSPRFFSGPWSCNLRFSLSSHRPPQLKVCFISLPLKPLFETIPEGQAHLFVEIGSLMAPLVAQLPKSTSRWPAGTLRGISKIRSILLPVAPQAFPSDAT